MDKKIVWQDFEGRVWVTHLDERDRLGSETDDEFTERFKTKLKGNPRFSSALVEVLDKSELPVEDENRDCWSIKNKKIEVDQIKVQSKLNKQLETSNIINKLGITKEEYDKLP